MVEEALVIRSYVTRTDDSAADRLVAVDIEIVGRYQAATLTDPPEYPQAHIVRACFDDTGEEVTLTAREERRAIDDAYMAAGEECGA